MERRRFAATETIRRFATALAMFAVTAIPVVAQNTDPLESIGYLRPPQEIYDAVMAPWYRNVEMEDLGPSAEYFVTDVEERSMTPLSLLARPFYNLAGEQIDYAANRARRLTAQTGAGFRLHSWRDGSATEVEIPDDAMSVSSFEWSPDGSRGAYLAHFDDATYVYVTDLQDGDSERLTDTPLLATHVTGFEWSGDGRHVFAVLVPEDRGAPPVEPGTASSPKVWTTREGRNELRTYRFESLMDGEHEFDLFEYYATGQLARIAVEGGDVEPIGEPAMITRIDPSPGGEYVRLELMSRPFSNLVQANDFPQRDVVWNLAGETLVELDSSPLDEGVDDDDDGDEGPERRDIQWRPDGDGLGFLQMEPAPESDDDDEEEDEEEDDERPDRVMQWLPPFEEGGAQVLYESENEIDEVRYSADPNLIFLTEEIDDEEHLYAVRLDEPAVRHTIYRYDTEDDDADDPGNLISRPGPLGGSVVRVSPDGGSVYLSGVLTDEAEEDEDEATPPRPFLDRVGIESGVSERLFLSSENHYEQVEAILDPEVQNVVISREAALEVPDYFHVDLTSGDEVQLTENVDYMPELTRRQVHEIEAERADGVMIRAEVSLPADWEEGTPLPAIFWHYPSEYESVEDYVEDDDVDNPNDFRGGFGRRSLEYLLLRGWAVVEPDIPIIGEGDSREWNEEFVPDIRNSFAAVIDEVSRRGWVDRDRLAVGGHSYGGFGTIHAMIQTPFFKAGIAGSPNSNRTLTPAGFQREQRTLWEARFTYMQMSPIFWMDQLNGALLIYHGEADQNVGTWPIHSRRSFHALNALGETAALYMYPYEGHGPAAEETNLDIWARWVAWLDTHVLGVGAEQEDDIAGGG